MADAALEAQIESTYRSGQCISVKHRIIMCWSRMTQKTNVTKWVGQKPRRFEDSATLEPMLLNVASLESRLMTSLENKISLETEKPANF